MEQRPENYFRKMTQAEQASALSESDAHEEANKLTEMVGNQATTEKYDSALRALEELIDSAESEGIPDKTRLIMKRAALQSLRGLNGALALIGAVIGLYNREKIGEAENLDKNLKEEIQNLRSFSKKLAELEKRAKPFEGASAA